MGENFASLGAASGTATPGNPGKLPLSLNANASQLAPGGHYALLRIVDPRALNSPQHVILVLDQASSASSPLPDPSPSGMFFTGAAGGSAPPTQVETVHTSSASPAAFQASASTSDDGSWLNVSPASGNSTSQTPGQVTVSVNLAGLAPGIYTGEVEIAISGVVRTVHITLVVRPAGTVAAMENEPASEPTAGCTPAKLALTQTGLVSNFSVPAKWPAALVVQLNDDCGNSVTNGSVVASFSNGDPPLTLRNDGQSGAYSATWQAGAVTPQMVITVQAGAGALEPATLQFTGTVSQNQAPLLARNGTVNAFHRTAAALAPGTVAEVYGTGLAGGTVSTGAPPLPTQSNGTIVLVGGIQAPLFYLSSGQLDIQIPSELAPSQQYVVIVSANGALTLPDVVDVVPMQPGVSQFADGHIIAQHVDGSLVDAAHPAKPSEVIVTYVLAMGPTNPSVASGAPSPVSPLAVVTTQPIVTVDGQNAIVGFAGLTPTYAGLYQINFTVPPGARSGDLTVLVTQNGIASNATKMPVQ
jgi:uncharacterized protein (TIGR03437 family)